MRLALVSSSVLLLSACGPGGLLGGGAHVSANVVAGSATGKGKSGLSQRQDALFGTPSGTSLASLKYAIKDLQLCTDVTRSGSGYSGTSGCFTLYANPNIPTDSAFYDGYLVTQALADTTPGRFVDLMTAAGQDELRNPARAQAAPAGTYRYGMVNFLRPIKVTADFPVVGTNQVIHSRATQGTAELAADGPFRNEQALVGDALTGPAEEMTYMLNNGGSYFAFAEPFVVTAEEASSGAAIKMDLVFNPDSFGLASSMASCANAQACDPHNNIVFDMPFVHLNPVPRKAGEETHKEVYLVDYDAVGGGKLRVELYYNASDAAKAVRGVDVAMVYPSTATNPVNNVVASDQFAQSGTVAGGDAAVSLKDYQATDTLTGLVRRASGNATLHCNLGGGVCGGTHSTSVQKAYTFEGDFLVSAD